MINIRKAPCGRNNVSSKDQPGLKFSQFARVVPRLSRTNLCLFFSLETSRDVLRCCFLAFINFVCYWNSLEGEFVHDDISAIVTNEDVVGFTPVSNLIFNDFWGEPLSSPDSHKSHRPLTTLTFRLNAAMHGMNTWGYHVVNISLHISVVISLYHLCRQVLTWDRNKSSITSLLFAIHPVHTEAVSNVVGRADILATLFFVLSIITHIRGQSSKSSHSSTCLNFRQILSVIFAAMSFLSKEQGIISFLFLALYEVMCGRSICNIEKKKPGSVNRSVIYNFVRTKVKLRLLSILATAGALLSIRAALMGIQLPVFSQEDNPASFSSSMKTRFLTYSYLPVRNAWLLLAPITLSYDWQIGSIPLIKKYTDIRNMATVALIIFLIAFIYYFIKLQKVNEKIVLCLGFVLPVLAFLPASNLFFYVGFVMAERILYLPSLGFCILVAHGMYKLHEKLLAVTIKSSSSISPSPYSLLQRSSFHPTQGKCRVLFFAFLSVLLFSNIIRTQRRNQVWLSRRALFSSGVRDLPQNAKIHYNYGNLLKDEGDTVTAEKHYREALAKWPYYASAHNNLATLLNDSQEAIHHLKQAIRYNPRHARAFYNLALLQSKRNLTTSAISLLETSIALDKNLVEVYSKLASMYFSVGRYHDADAIHKIILSMKIDNADVANNYGVFLEQTGKVNEAMKYYQLAIEREAGHSFAVMNICRLLETRGRLNEAKLRYERYMDMFAYNPEMVDCLGSLLIRLQRFDEAAKLYEQLLERVPNYNRAKLHYAQILMDQKKYVKAEDNLLSIINQSSSAGNNAVALFELATLYKRMNRTTEALEYILMGISACEGNSDVCANFYVLHGDIMKYLKYLDEAAQSYKMALDLKPGLYHAHVNLGAIYHLQSEYRQAWRHYLAAKVLHPTHPVLLENIAKLERAQMSSLPCDDTSLNSCW